jgi:hypothetical protein
MFGNAQRSFFQGLEKTGSNFSKPWKKDSLRFPSLGQLLAVVVFALPAQAGETKLPAGVYPLSQVQAAQDEAAKSGKALAFVLSELKGKTAKAAAPNTNYAFDKLKGICVPVYVDYVEDLKGLHAKQPLVTKALTSNLAGKTIPRVAVTDTEFKRVLAVVSTMPMGVMGDGVYEDACKQIQDYLKDPAKSVTLEAGKKEKGKRKR